MREVDTKTLRRIIAFIRGDQESAEALYVPDVPEVEWILNSKEDEALASYALDVAHRSADFANTAVSRVQDKAASLMSFILSVIPFAGAAAGLVLARRDKSFWLAITAFGLFVVVVILLAAAALRAFLSSGSLLSAGVNAGRLSRVPRPKRSEVASTEASVWHESAIIAMANATQRSWDLFAARRLLVFALVGATGGAGLLAALHAA